MHKQGDKVCDDTLHDHDDDRHLAAKLPLHRAYRSHTGCVQKAESEEGYRTQIAEKC